MWADGIFSPFPNLTGVWEAHPETTLLFDLCSHRAAVGWDRTSTGGFAWRGQSRRQWGLEEPQDTFGSGEQGEKWGWCMGNCRRQQPKQGPQGLWKGHSQRAKSLSQVNSCFPCLSQQMQALSRQGSNWRQTLWSSLLSCSIGKKCKKSDPKYFLTGAVLRPAPLWWMVSLNPDHSALLSASGLYMCVSVHYMNTLTYL